VLAKHHNPNKNRQQFHNADEKKAVREMIAEHGLDLPKCDGIFTFPGETEKDVLNFHSLFPTAKIYGCENLKTVAIHCNFKSYGVDFTLDRGNFHELVEANALSIKTPIHIAWLDYQELTAQKLFKSAKLFAEQYMPDESIMAVTFIDADDLVQNIEAMMVTLHSRDPIVEDQRTYRATKTTMQSILLRLKSAT